jgi:threonine aldolase
MNQKYVDLRSDTITKPSPAMRRAMMDAQVGDDVFGEDPTVNALQSRICELFKKEASLFVPSGTMGNEVCIKVHTHPGDEIIVDQDSHIFIYETAGPSLLSGVQMMPIAGVRGRMSVEQIKSAIRPRAYYLPVTKLICFENTHGRSGGSIIPLEEIRKVRNLALIENIKMHLDGARLWNASVATGIPLAEYAENFDSLSVCFSKGLGAPVGSIILGDKKFIEQALVYRKIFGGGMRQAGILAAAAIYALDNNVERLKEDHDKALVLFSGIRNLKGITMDPGGIDTNMVIADISATGRSQLEILDSLKSKGLLLTPERNSSIRAVTHLDVSMEEIERAVKICETVFV